MSKTLLAVIIGLVLLTSLILFSTTYTVRFHEVAIRTRFGQSSADDIILTPGLHFRLPFFADRITTLDTRLQLRESPFETVLTSDGLEVMARGYLLWQVDRDGQGPLAFAGAYPSGIDEANADLTSQFRTALNAGLSRFRFDELVGSNSRLPEAEDAIKREMSSITAKGMKPVSVGISQLMFTPKASTAVLTRMRITRENVAQNERSRGSADAAAINSRAGALSDKIIQFANQRAEEIRSRGNAKAAEYFTELAKDEDLAILIAWIDALKQALSQNTTLVIPTIFAPFHMMQLDTVTDARGIPKPSDEMLAETPGVQPPARIAKDGSASEAVPVQAPPTDGGP
jgi:membrane protease subunit HflC